MMDKALLYAILKNKSGAEISASGNPVTLSGTLADNPLKDCKIYGWSKQKSTTGAQLLDLQESDIRKDSGLTVTLGEDGTITVDGTPKAAYVQVVTKKIHLEPGIYYASGGKKGAGYIYSQMNIKGSDGTWNYLSNTPIYIDGSEQEIQYIIQTLNTGAAVENYTMYPMLNVGAKALPWEPYTGGQPSPSPDYPQEIESAGVESAGIAVTVRGKNLLNFEEFLKTRGVIYTKESEIYQITEIRQAYSNPYKFSGEDIRVVISGIVDDVTSNDMRVELLNSSNERVAFISAGKGFQKCKASYIRLNYIGKGTCNIQKVQIERGVTATAYEPYHTSQSLSIQTPTGLPAIPVDTGGNYTDANGQQWVADYVDLKRGKYVQNVWQKTFDGSEDEKWKKGSIYYVYSECLPVVMNIRKGFCSQYIVGNDKRGIRIGNGNNSLIIFDDFSDENAFSNFKANLSVNPFKVMTYLDEPIERDLTPSEIQAYKELATYAGTTIVENDADCYMEVSSGGGDALRAKKLALILGD